MLDTMRAAAAFAAATGWRVFPTQNKRPPPGFKWQDQAEAVGNVAALPWQDADGYGVLLPHGVMVLDLDAVEGDLSPALTELADTLPAEALESVRAGLNGAHGWCVQTRSGGRHIYLLAPPGQTRQTKIGPHVDVRLGGRGYVVGPGSPGYTLVAGEINPKGLRLFPLDRFRRPTG